MTTATFCPDCGRERYGTHAYHPRDDGAAMCYCGRWAICENGLCQMHHDNSAKVIGNPCYREALRLVAPPSKKVAP